MRYDNGDMKMKDVAREIVNTVPRDQLDQVAFELRKLVDHLRWKPSKKKRKKSENWSY